MSAMVEIDKLGSTLFGKTRRAILALLYSHPDEAFYLRQIARMTGVGMGALQRELKQLTEAGILTRNVIGQQAFFKANPDCPVYRELRDIVVKTFGVADILGEAFSPLADKIRAAFIYGSMAGDQFNQSSDVDVVVIGDISFADVVSALSPVQEVLSREINPSVYPPEEFKTRLSEKQHFIKSVLNSPKIFIIGNKDELEELAR
jgi:DNA-binding transcriptional ArsR family regulator